MPDSSCSSESTEEKGMEKQRSAARSRSPMTRIGDDGGR